LGLSARSPRDVARCDRRLERLNGAGVWAMKAEAGWAVEVERDEVRLGHPMQARRELVWRDATQLRPDRGRARKVDIKVSIDNTGHRARRGGACIGGKGRSVVKRSCRQPRDSFLASALLLRPTHCPLLT
jgi:hypothetical protein